MTARFSLVFRSLSYGNGSCGGGLGVCVCGGGGEGSEAFRQLANQIHSAQPHTVVYCTSVVPICSAFITHSACILYCVNVM